VQFLPGNISGVSPSSLATNMPKSCTLRNTLIFMVFSGLHKRETDNIVSCSDVAAMYATLHSAFRNCVLLFAVLGTKVYILFYARLLGRFDY
ncbi:hypothetical protein K8T06_15465, partial [bacterium]|nr:hypothetical protein [bacterium]